MYSDWVIYSEQKFTASVLEAESSNMNEGASIWQGLVCVCVCIEPRGIILLNHLPSPF